MLERPFRVLGLQQVAIGGPEMAPLLTLWASLLGLPQIGEFESEGENVYEKIFRLGEGKGAVEVDLMVPLDPDRKPRVDKPPLNHIGLWVSDLEAAVAWLEGKGLRFAPGGIRTGASGHKVAFIHPRGNEDFPLSGEGVLLELVQAPKDMLSE